MASQPRTATRTMESTATTAPVRSGSTVSADDSSGSSGMAPPAVHGASSPLTVTAAEDRVRKFQKTAEHGSRLRKTSASNALSARAPPAPSNPALRGRNKVPLGPRERPHDFSKQR